MVKIIEVLIGKPMEITRVYQYTIVMSLQPPFGDANKTCCKLL
jgi:hypothetical protein